MKWRVYNIMQFLWKYAASLHVLLQKKKSSPMCGFSGIVENNLLLE